tara:strand:- start:271 stop:516 length:246 start_codon:yes stop_codon:yes gene_type:complete
LSQFYPEVGELVLIWDMLFEIGLDFVIYDRAYLIEHHGEIGIVLSNSYLNQDYREILVAGYSEVYHVDNLQRVPDIDYEEG